VFSLAYIFFMWIGYIHVPFDFGMFCFFILVDVLVMSLQRLLPKYGRKIYEKLKKWKVKVANA